MAHAPMQWMAKVKDINAQVTHWFISLRDLSFQVQHRVRVHHGNADGLYQRYELWASTTLTVGSELRDGYTDRESSSHVHKLPHVPHATASKVLKGQSHFSTTVWYCRKIHGDGSE